MAPVHGQPTDISTKEVSKPVHNEYSSFQYTTLASKIAICRNMLENNGRISPELFCGSPLYLLEDNGRFSPERFRNSPLYELERNGDHALARWQSFLDGSTAVFRGTDRATIEWLTINAAMLERAGIGLSIETDGHGTPFFSLNNPSVPPGVLTEMQKLELRNMMQQAGKAVERRDFAKAEAIAGPVIAFLEVSRQLDSSPPTPSHAILHTICERAYRELQSGRGAKAKEILDAEFDFLVAEKVLAQLPQDFPQDIRWKLNDGMNSALKHLADRDFKKAALISKLILERVEREADIMQMASGMEKFSNITSVIDVAKSRGYRECDGVNTPFSEERFFELTGVAYNEYLDGDAKGRKGVGLPMARKMELALASLRSSAIELDNALADFSYDKDREGQNSRAKSEKYLREAVETSNAADNMFACYRIMSSVPLKDIEEVNLERGSRKHLTQHTRAALLKEKYRTIDAAHDLIDGMSDAIMLFAVDEPTLGLNAVARMNKSVSPVLNQGIGTFKYFMEEDRNDDELAAYKVSLGLELGFVLLTLGSGALEVGLGEFTMEEMGTLSVKQLSILAAKSVLTTYMEEENMRGLGDSYFNWRIAEINNEPPDTVERLRLEFIRQLFVSSANIGGKFAEGELSAQPTSGWGAYIGKTNLERVVWGAKAIDFGDKSLTTLENAKDTLAAVEEKRWGEALLDTCKTIEPFGLDYLRDEYLSKALKSAKQGHHKPG